VGHIDTRETAEDHKTGRYDMCEASCDSDCYCDSCNCVCDSTGPD